MGLFSWIFGGESPVGTLTDDLMIRSIQSRAATGDPAAQYHLAVEYQNGKLIQKNDRLALEWAKKAAIQGNASAQVFLGRCYELGQGCDQDISKAAEWYLRGARSLYDASNQPMVNFAKNALGFIYSRCQLSLQNQDGQEVIVWLAENPGVPAQLCLARIYALGIGLMRDESLAAKYFLRALEFDQRNANELASSLPNGERLCLEYSDHLNERVDFSQAVDWLAMAAERGVATAQYAIGEIHLCGYRGISVNAELAFSWYHKAALNGDIAAQSKLGRMLANGVGVQQNEKDAYFTPS